MELVFTNKPPQDGADYLVRGRLEAPNGYDGEFFLVCTVFDGEWYVAPDGPPLSHGLSMWNGGLANGGNAQAPFTPVAWARLPDPVEGPVV